MGQHVNYLLVWPILNKFGMDQSILAILTEVFYLTTVSIANIMG